jgi:hypothetical protein
MHASIGYYPYMFFFLRHIGRYAAQKLASNPQVREKAAKIARAVMTEAQEIARKENGLELQDRLSVVP